MIWIFPKRKDNAADAHCGIDRDPLAEYTMMYIYTKGAPAMIQKSMAISPEGKLRFGGADVEALARKYGTPLYILDEGRLVENMRAFVRGAEAAFGRDTLVTYASKAMCFKALYPILEREGLGADVVSGGELYTARQAGFPMNRVHFHGTYKEDWEIDMALQAGVHSLIADGEYDLENIARRGRVAGILAPVMLRITPGIDPHTFAAVNTGMECQFGRPLETGQAMEFVKTALKQPGVRVLGLHCHIGSQIFEEGPFALAAEKMLNFCRQILDEIGWSPEYLALGGGFGVRYRESDPECSVEHMLRGLGETVRRLCREKGVPQPKIILEPGRSIVADAGMTLYTAGAVKQIVGGRNYVIVNGGMTDNPRYALYKAPYTVYNASRMTGEDLETYTVAGRCCESGALIQENVRLPRVQGGDFIAVACTGAYNYAMASNYNRVPRLPVVLVKDGADRLAVRRETLEDLLKCDI